MNLDLNQWFEFFRGEVDFSTSLYRDSINCSLNILFELKKYRPKKDTRKVIDELIDLLKLERKMTYKESHNPFEGHNLPEVDEFLIEIISGLDIHEPNKRLVKIKAISNLEKLTRKSYLNVQNTWKPKPNFTAGGTRISILQEFDFQEEQSEREAVKKVTNLDILLNLLDIKRG